MRLRPLLYDLTPLAEYIRGEISTAQERNTMEDKTLIRLCEETNKYLSQTITVNPASQMIPSYNAVLEAAKAAHPDHPFLRILLPLTADNEEPVSVGEIMALFAQIRIVLESFRDHA